MKNKLPTEWQELSDQLSFQEFTPIQTQLFEPLLAGENLLGVSPTGTGKTLAYLLPSLLRLQKKKAQQLLILAPNTELAGQIFDVCRTPGRIFELIKLKKIKMMNVETIILDEFDQLLDDSQIHFVEKITHYAPRDHQLVYMSATTKFNKEKIAPNTRTIDLSDQKLDNIQHFYMQVDQRHRVDMLRKLAHVEDFRGLVFFNSLSDLGSAEEKLQYRDILAVSLASDVNVKFRKVILEKFKDKQLTLLLATDLLARGIDIDSLECVVNFDVPRDIETYTHRAGRTGRMGKEGYVITLVTHPEEIKKLKKFTSVREIVLKNQELYIK